MFVFFLDTEFKISTAFIYYMMLLRKGTLIQNYVIEVKVAVLLGEHRAVWLTDASTFQGSLPSPIL